MFKFPNPFIKWIKACITTAMFSVKVNGSLCGYFKSGRGLRQGDPLSPYLFVLTMEVLSIILHKGSTQPSFKHHWRVKADDIAHLCFTDDLLVFCNGDLQSVRIMHSCIMEFSQYSDLPNAAKSHCYLANVTNDERDAIISCLGYFLGTLPVKFLGVPLITSKLSHQDCIPLIQKITARVSSWTNCTLSYSGRLQLIKSILFSIQSFWAAHFILPKGVLKNIQ